MAKERCPGKSNSTAGNSTSMSDLYCRNVGQEAYGGPSCMSCLDESYTMSDGKCLKCVGGASLSGVFGAVSGIMLVLFLVFAVIFMKAKTEEEEEEAERIKEEKAAKAGKTIKKKKGCCGGINKKPEKKKKKRKLEKKKTKQEKIEVRKSSVGTKYFVDGDMCTDFLSVHIFGLGNSRNFSCWSSNR